MYEILIKKSGQPDSNQWPRDNSVTTVSRSTNWAIARLLSHLTLTLLLFINLTTQIYMGFKD